VLSCDVIIWDDNTPLFYFSWKLHSLGTGRAPETRARTRKRRVMGNDAERCTRIYQKSVASQLVHQVKKAARGDGAYTPPAA
jgi:hypothetical protein